MKHIIRQVKAKRDTNYFEVNYMLEMIRERLGVLICFSNTNVYFILPSYNVYYYPITYATILNIMLQS